MQAVTSVRETAGLLPPAKALAVVAVSPSSPWPWPPRLIASRDA